MAKTLMYGLNGNTEVPLQVDANGVLTGGGTGGGGDASAANQALQITQETAINTALGTVTASPTTNTVLARLKDLLTGIILATGSNIIGRVGIDQTTPGTTDSVSVKTRAKTVATLLNAVTTNQTSAAAAVPASRRAIQASISGTGAVSGTVTVFGNNTNAASGGVLLATLSLSGTSSDVTGADIPAEWPFMYCTLASISGTGAAVTVSVGY